MDVSASVRAEKSLLSDSSNNELFIINLAMVRGRMDSTSPPAQKEASRILFYEVE